MIDKATHEAHLKEVFDWRRIGWTELGPAEVSTIYFDRAYSLRVMDSDPVWETRMVVPGEYDAIIQWRNEEAAKLGHLAISCYALAIVIETESWLLQISD